MQENLTASIEIYTLNAVISAGATAAMVVMSFIADMTPLSFNADVGGQQLIAQAQSGMQGIPGSAAEDILMLAGMDISALRVVRGARNGAIYANSSDIDDMDTALGITSSAANTGEDAIVRSFGDMEDCSWTWVPGSIFFDSLGRLTQSAPITGFVQQVATAATATQITVNIKQSIKLA